MKKSLLISSLAAIMLMGAGCAPAAPSGEKGRSIEPAPSANESGAMEKTSPSPMPPEGDMDKKMPASEADKADGDAMMKAENKMLKKDPDKMMVKDDAAAPGVYEDFSADKLARAKTGKVVLFFKADWCPTCRQVDSDIKTHLSDIPAEVSLLKVNYDTAIDLRQKYGVTYQHTFVQVDADGNRLEKWSGSPTLSDITSHVR